jgi:hypothetical protein
MIITKTRLSFAVGALLVPISLAHADSNIVCRFNNPDWRFNEFNEIQIEHRAQTVEGGLIHALRGTRLVPSWGVVSASVNQDRTQFKYGFKLITPEEEVSCDSNGSGGPGQPVRLDGEGSFWSDFTCPTGIQTEAIFSLKLNAQRPSDSELTIAWTTTFSGGLSFMGPYGDSKKTNRLKADCVVGPL